jgi:catechol 2,3-dioxygenase-like lactoylglutathione lyase family enzyme
VIRVEDPSGNPIEFISFGANGLHRQSEGLYLSERRISKRIHHVGLYAEIPGDQDPFYSDILKFVEIMRYPENRDLPPTLLYFGMKECTESIEHYFPADRDFSHPCFLVDDMQETIYALHKRRGNELLEKPVVGKSNRWILNLRNADGTRIEFTEAHTKR